MILAAKHIKITYILQMYSKKMEMKEENYGII